MKKFRTDLVALGRRKLRRPDKIRVIASRDYSRLAPFGMRHDNNQNAAISTIFTDPFPGMDVVNGHSRKRHCGGHAAKPATSSRHASCGRRHAL